MNFPYQITNRSFLLPEIKENAYEVWYWKLNPIDALWSFWFRFTLLKSPTKSVAEVWGIFSLKSEKQNLTATQNIAVKETFPMNECHYQSATNSLTINNNFVDFTTSRGHIQRGDKQIKWNLNLMPIAPQESFNFVPLPLWKMKIVKNYAVTVHEKMLFSGDITVNQETMHITDALGMQGHLAGTKQGHSWAWAHSCIFYDEASGETVPFIIDILTARARIGSKFASPPLTTLFLHDNGKSYFLNSLHDILKTQSHYVPLYWEFKTKTENLHISGSISADIATVVGVEYEDTDGSHLFCYNTKMATMELNLFDPILHKERRLISQNKCAFEWVQREKWNKVPISI